MKKRSLVFVIAMTFIMVLTMSMSVFAAESITITPPSKVDASAQNTYKVYKVFDAQIDASDSTKITYTLRTGDTLSQDMINAGFSVTNGFVSGPASLNQAAIDAIKAFVTEDDLVDTVVATGPNAVTTKELDYGYYYITTTTGSVVTIDTNNDTPTAVNDKNSVPEVDKKITGATSIDEDGKKALAQVGTDVEYTAKVKVGDGAKDYVFHDTMETGLTYNNDVSIEVDGTVIADTNYTVGKEGNDTFTVTFSNDWIKTLTTGTIIDVIYSANVNDDAITVDPLNNTAYVSYGDKNANNKTPITEADVYEAKISVIKNDDKNKPIAGAGFVLKNAAGKYYKITNKVVSWVDSIDDATEYISGDDGKLNGSFTGLANGTYTLEEKTVPAGYNKAADQDVTIAEHNYEKANLEQEATVVNNPGVELPTTGGIGTTIFYILGSLLVVGCGIVLISKKRMQNNK